MSVCRRRTVLVVVGVAVGGLLAAGSVPAGASPGPGPCTVYVAGDGVAHAASGSDQCCPNGKKAIGVVSFSKGQGAPSVGTPVCAGDRIGGPFVRVEVTVPGGSWNLWPGTSATMGANGNLTGVGNDFDGTFTSTKAGRKRHARDAAVAGAPLPSAELDTASGSVGLYADASGVEACTITIHGGKVLLHVVAGSGYATVSGRPPLHVSAGYGATVTSAGASLTTSWPAGARKLLPSAMLPPRLTELRYRTTPRPGVVFVVDRAVVVQLRVLRGAKLARAARVTARRGTNAVTVARLRRGRYQLIVVATDANRDTTVVQQQIVVR